MTYSSDSIKHIEPLDHIRLRPGMYIGSVGQDGIHHLFNEVLDNSVDEHLAGYCKEIIITLNGSSICVQDNGRGIPVGYNKSLKMDSLTAIFTKTMTGGKFEDTYEVSSGLNGIGLKAVTALSQSLEVKAYHKGNTSAWSQMFSKGKILNKLESRGKSPDNLSGTKIKFTPDTEIFGEESYDPEYIKQRCSYLVAILPKLSIILYDSGKEFVYSGGEYLKPIHNKNLGEEMLECYFVGDDIQFMFTYHKSNKTSMTSFINTINTTEHGSHVDAILMSVTQAFKKITGKVLSTNQITQGLSLTVSTFFKNPVYRGQNKTRVHDAKVRSHFHRKVYPVIWECLKKNKEFIKYFISLIESQEKLIEEAAVEDVVKSIKSNSRENRLPQKLMSALNCTTDERELYIVEGSSAAGGFRKARNAHYQEVLPLKGKILNPFKVEFKNILRSKEVLDIFNAIGGIEGNDNNLRTKKVFICTDADVDGNHITCLLLSLFTSLYPSFIEKFDLYVVHPPLFSLESGDTRVYGHTPKECVTKAKKMKLKSWQIYRNKGLGEQSPHELAELANPKTRSITKIELNDESKQAMENLMGIIGNARHQIVNELESYEEPDYTEDN